MAQDQGSRQSASLDAHEAKVGAEGGPNRIPVRILMRDDGDPFRVPQGPGDFSQILHFPSCSFFIWCMISSMWKAYSIDSSIRKSSSGI